MTISCKAIRSACFSLEKKTLFSRRTQSLGDGTCVLDQADFFFNIRLSPVHLFVPLLGKVITEKKNTLHFKFPLFFYLYFSWAEMSTAVTHF